MESGKLEELRHIARGIAAQFGPNCEVVVHDLSQHPDHTIVAIENGHVSGRKVGDGASNVVLERMEHQDQEAHPHAGRQGAEILHHLHSEQPGQGDSDPRHQF